MNTLSIKRRSWNLALLTKPAVWSGIVFFLLWSASTTLLLLRKSDGAEEGIAIMVIFGLILPALVWLVTRKVTNLPAPAMIAQPKRETAAILLYMAAFSIIVLGWGLSAIKASVPAGQSYEITTLLLKLVTMLMLPLLILKGFGHRLSDIGSWGLNNRRMTIVFLAISVPIMLLMVVVTRGVPMTIALHPSAMTVAWALPACFIWMMLAAALCEEILVRAILLNRLSALMRSDVAAIFISALVFGLLHAPGYYLRGGALEQGGGATPDVLWSIAFSIASIAPIGLFFGFLWVRTRSLGIIILLHAMIDTVSQLHDFLHTWAGL